MPNHNTFLIKPIREFVQKHILNIEGDIIDPFANGSRLANITNEDSLTNTLINSYNHILISNGMKRITKKDNILKIINNAIDDYCRLNINKLISNTSLKNEIISTNQNLQNIHSSVNKILTSSGITVKNFGETKIKAIEASIAKYADKPQLMMMWIKENDQQIDSKLKEYSLALDIRKEKEAKIEESFKNELAKIEEERKNLL